MSSSPRPGVPYRAKRLLDVVAIILTSPIWLPLLAVVGIAVRLRIGTPVLFRQTRPGRHEKPFVLTKFRTMTDGRETGGQPLSDADRLTDFGRFLRSTSLDELPELLNVLRGEMSLVGPRPLLMQYLPLYSPRHRRRHDVPPGLTGLAQVSGRNALTWSDRLEQDVRYVEQCSLKLDAWILWRTFAAVLKRRGISAAGEATMPPFLGYGPPDAVAPASQRPPRDLARGA